MEFWGNDSTSVALCVEEFPPVVGYILAEGGCARAVGSGNWISEVEGPLKEKSWVGQGNRVCPGDIPGRVGDNGWFEFDAFVVVDNAVLSGGVPVP